MFEKQVVIDGKGHMLGRLASVIAKELLGGQQVVVVRCEQIVVSGSLIRNKMKWARFKKKRMNTNPSRGPYHFRSPGKILWRTIRGMVPHKTTRGSAAMARLMTFEGVPDDFVKTKRMVVPDALKVLHSKTYRKTTLLGRISTEAGWKHGELIQKLEAARIAKGAAYYAAKKEDNKLKAKAEGMVDCSSLNSVLQGFGYYVEPTAPGAMKAIKEEFKSELILNVKKADEEEA
jgi:large subunit ribosomal protein L13Ae